MDRLFLGLVLSGLTIASALHLAWMAQAEAISWGDVVFHFIGWAFFAVIAVFIVQLPIWAVLHLLRVPDWAGSLAAGTAAGASCAVVFRVLSNHPPPAAHAVSSVYLYLLIGAVIGAIAGSVGWRFAKADGGL